MSDRGRRTEIRQAIRDGEARLRGLKLSPVSKSLAILTLRFLRQQDASQVVDSIDVLLRDLDNIHDVLRQMYERGRQAETAEAAAEPFGDAWFAEFRRRLANATDAGAVSMTLDPWLQALADGAWKQCERIMEIGQAALEKTDVPRHLRAILHAVETDDGRRSLPGIVANIEALERFDASESARLRLLVLKSRALRRKGHTEQAVVAATEANKHLDSVGPGDHALARAALAEALTVAGRKDEAGLLVADVLEVIDELPDRLIAAGLLAAADGLYGQSNDYFEIAALRFHTEAARPRLMRDVTGNVLAAVAIDLGPFEATALDYFDKALEAGIIGKSDYPERKVYLDKAELLENLGRDLDAAEAYLAAAERYDALGLDRAHRLYRKAIELNPDDPAPCWHLGEHLRNRAVDADGIVNQAEMAEAIAVLDSGFDRARDHPAEWALVSAGLAHAALDPTADNALWIERAFLADSASWSSYGHLAALLRQAGFPAEALEAAEQGSAEHGLSEADGHAQLVAPRIWALADLGRFDDALAVLDAFVRSFGTHPELSLAASWLHLRADRPDAALAEVDVAEVEDETDRLALRALILAASGDYAGERGCYEAIWNKRGAGTRAGLAGRAAFRIGLIDDAMKIFSDLVDRGPRIFEWQSDLAQVLLVRGARDEGDDLSEARDRLVQAIAAATVSDDLRQVITLDLPLALTSVQGAARQADAERIIGDAIDLGSRRVADLRQRRRSPDLVSVRLARARVTAKVDPVDAIGQYRELRNVLPEHATDSVIASLVAAEISRGETAVTDNDVVTARERWTRLEQLQDAIDLAGELRQRLNALQGLATLELDGPTPEARQRLATADENAIVDSLARFARTVGTAWTHHDGLQLVGRADDIDRAARKRIGSCADRLPFNAVYRLRRADVGPETVSPLARAIELALSPSYRALAESEYFWEAIPKLRQSLSTTSGVKIPGVRVYVDEELPPDSVRIAIYERPMRQERVAAVDSDDDRHQRSVRRRIIDLLDEVLRQNLFRWVAVDDIELWLAGWDVKGGPSPAGKAPTFDTTARLQLVRLLRDLLREGVSIGDRDAIIAGWQAAGCDQARVLPAVRSRLFPAIVGNDADAVRAALPGAFITRLSAGFATDDSDTWQLSRTATAQIADELHQWLDGPPIPAVVVVPDDRLRPVVWRLLASRRPRVYVVAAKELP